MAILYKLGIAFLLLLLLVTSSESPRLLIKERASLEHTPIDLALLGDVDFSQPAKPRSSQDHSWTSPGRKAGAVLLKWHAPPSGPSRGTNNVKYVPSSAPSSGTNGIKS